MVAAAGDRRRRSAPFPARPHAEAHPRMADQRPHAAHRICAGPNGAVAVDETRAEVDDLDALAGRVEEPGAQHRRCPRRRPARSGRSLPARRRSTRVAGRRRLPEQGMKDRIPVEAGHAAPDDGALPIDQGADRAVSDQGEFEAAGCVMGRLARNEENIQGDRRPMQPHSEPNNGCDEAPFHARGRSGPAGDPGVASPARIRFRRHARADRGASRRCPGAAGRGPALETIARDFRSPSSPAAASPT